MKLQNDRIINGLLKADIGFLTPEEVDARLAQNVAIYVKPTRAGAGDLWPCVWFLAAVLERQFTGKIFISAGLREALSSPIPLGPRCEFVSGQIPEHAIAVFLGAKSSSNGEITFLGDARGNKISYGRLLSTNDPANPITCCALAGYLGFAALAHAVGIPAFREEWQHDSLRLPFSASTNAIPPLSVLGTGQVGQAFLALTYFLTAGRSLAVHLLDKDCFEDYNQRTQILLPQHSDGWNGRPKVKYLAEICRHWGWTVFPEQTTIKWGWKHDRQDRPLAFLGFDNMDARKIAVEGGFQWLFECGVGTDFCHPRVTWHSIPPDRLLAKHLFREPVRRTQPPSPFAKSLADSPADCGRVVFDNIEASAPSLGLVAVSATWAEIMRFLAGDHEPYSGTTLAWSPLLPSLREPLGALLNKLSASEV
jgi:hypothetical protein